MSLAPATTQQYARVWEHFEAAMRERQTSVVGPDQFEYLCYLQDLIQECVESGTGPQRACLTQAAVRHFHKLAGAPSPTDDPRCAAILATASKVLQAKPLDREALQASDLLVALRHHMGGNTQPELHVRMHLTVFLIMYAGMLRFSDVENISVDESTMRFLRGVDGSLEGVVLFVPFSKRDQPGRGQWVPVGATGGQWCPVRLLEQLIQVGGFVRAPPPGHDAGPLLRALRRDKGQTQQRLLQVTAPVARPVATVRREYFASSVRALLAEAGITARISTHSARSGGATSAETQAVAKSMIRTIGRWKHKDVLMDHYVKELEADAKRFFAVTRAMWPY
mmetsp:Transcript_4797/g.14550  ORF Transcript_4797/g.14550 Transcript_4797/m.14550 type:complete len:337 (-) Transcript_4797:237-1247(-)